MKIIFKFKENDFLLSPIFSIVGLKKYRFPIEKFGNYTKKLLFCLFYLFPLLLFAEVAESYSKKEVQVGEESVLEVKFNAGDVAEWNLPAKGFIFSESDAETPIGELKDIVQTPTELKFFYIYFSPGSFKANLKWKDATGEFVSSQEVLNVKTVLSGEKEALDIVEPMEFSGSYLLRLFIIVIAGIAILVGIAYLLFYYNNKKKLPVKDALFEKIEVDKDIDYYKNQLHKMFLEKEISHKEFIFHLSGYIKERIGTKRESSLLHLTQSEVHEILQSEYRVPNLELLTIDNYFNSIKYMPNEEMISRDNALALVKYWDKILTR